MFDKDRDLYFLLMLLIVLLIIFLHILLAQYTGDTQDQTSSPVTTMPEQTVDTDFNIQIITWNVAQSSPPYSINKLFSTNTSSYDGKRPEVYAIGLQELPWTSFIVQPYIKVFDEYFSNKNYVRLKDIRSGTVMLLVYVRRDQLINYYYVSTDSRNLKWTGTKAAVAVRFFINNLSICLIGAHLAAHEDQYETRINEFHQSVQSLKFSEQQYDNVFHQDMVFFFGDLNFRIDDFDTDQVMQYIDTKQYDQLLKHDQLYKALATNTLQGFQEEPIAFAPTYRFVKQTNLYDHSNRKPAYTDRVLYRNFLMERAPNDEMRNAAQFKLFNYRSIWDLNNSDHKPVTITVSIPDKVNQIAPSIRLASLSLRSGRSVRDAETDPGQPTNQYPTLHDPSTDSARYLRVNFEEISPLTSRRNFSVYFNVEDRRSGRLLSANSSDLNEALSTWDWIGLYKIDFMSPNDYLTFAYAKFRNTDLVDVEAAQDALLLSHQISPIQDNSSSPSSHFDHNLITTDNETIDQAVSSSLSSPQQQQHGEELVSHESTAQSTSSDDSSPAEESSPVSSIRPESGDHSISPIGHRRNDSDNDSIDRPKSDKSLTTKKDSKSSTQLGSPKTKTTEVPLDSGVSEDTLSISSSSILSREGEEEEQQQNPERVEQATLQTDSADTRFSVQFDNQDFAFFPGRYVLLYVRQNGDVLGVSEPFEKVIDDSDEELYRDDENQL